MGRIRRIKLLEAFVIGLAIFCITLLFPISVVASPDSEATLPIASVEWDGQYARIPNWSEISFHTLPPILEDGEFVAPSDLNQALGYDLSRQWKAGQTADSYLKLGDFQTSLYPQFFNLYTIAQLTRLDLKQVALSNFKAATQQTLDQLVTALPGLDSYRLNQVPAIAALFNQQFPGTPGFNPSSDSTITEILSANPQFGQLSLGQLGQKLDQFSISDIPNLQNVPLQNLANWENSLISEVPGLGSVPLAQMPNPIQATGMIGIVDVVYGTAESDRRNTISGSDREGFQVPCKENCAYIELAGAPPLYGKQWISGKYQKVKGGSGILGAVNNGKEPTGRHPFGDVFKVSVWDVDEGTGTISTALHFRICKRGLPDLGCTPYFLGPVPFLNYHEKEPIFTGLLDSQGGASSGASIPDRVIDRAKAMGIPAEALPGYQEAAFGDDGGICGIGAGNVDFKALAAAFSSIEGNYGSAGSFVCDGDGNCGRGLGRYQYMSYRSDVRASIQRQEGGSAFLSKADSGAAISEAEITRFFPASAQDNIFKADQTRNIQQAQREGFSGERLIERIGQIHFGGPYAPIDGNATDGHGRLTLKTYGEELARNYKSAAKSNGNCTKSASAKSTGRLIAPVSGYPVTSDFGARESPCAGCSSFHRGLDLGTPEGTSVRAADGGKVIYAGWAEGYGNVVIIEHSNGMQTRYAHLSEMTTQVGTSVRQGQPIARSGHTGLGTGPHLHFEVRTGASPGQPFSGTAVDPRKYTNL
ncbi:MAG: M23 family metallopeptidase [Leptolyngbya sp. Prado105]|jgi:murein DD-endopeptidase MepM/ murein hydrolase activator NlpD|nr:M23 family metallopeptidase [Leptolyngbya sp. Prado105]